MNARGKPGTAAKGAAKTAKAGKAAKAEKPKKPTKAAAAAAPVGAADAASQAAGKPEWQLRLYVAGNTSRSKAALDNLRALCESHLAGRYSIEVIDLLVNPTLAAGDQILAVPTLVRKFPEPMRKIIGDLSNEQRVLVGLDVRPVA